MCLDHCGMPRKETNRAKSHHGSLFLQQEELHQNSSLSGTRGLSFSIPSREAATSHSTLKSWSVRLPRQFLKTGGTSTCTAQSLSNVYATLWTRMLSMKLTFVIREHDVVEGVSPPLAHYSMCSGIYISTTSYTIVQRPVLGGILLCDRVIW